MPPSETFPFRLFPRRLVRSLVSFAGAGTLMAGVVYADGAGGPALPAIMLAAALAIPGLFAWQIRRRGYDPLDRLELTDDGLLAVQRDGSRRLLPWQGLSALVRVRAYRADAWAVCHERLPAVRWFGELEDEDRFVTRLAERTGLAWEDASAPPEDPA